MLPQAKSKILGHFYDIISAKHGSSPMGESRIPSERCPSRKARGGSNADRVEQKAPDLRDIAVELKKHGLPFVIVPKFPYDL